ncbi:MAG: ethanolamine ammonia-lyase subunit EutC [Rhodospirillaceae bacterium]
MSSDPKIPAVQANPWTALRRYTAARIALGRAGASLPTRPQLDFQQAHAMARDAVHTPLDVERLCADLDTLGLAPLRLHSAAADRATYLQRPDLGRALSPTSRQLLEALPPSDPAPDVALVIADGLSAFAVQSHATPLVTALLPGLKEAQLSLAPVSVVEQGRVAVGDEIGALLQAKLVVLLVGERPGLSAPDSLGVYLTHAPRPGRTDAERNCLSNIRPEGLSYALAAYRLLALIQESLRRGVSGVALKDETDAVVVEGANLEAGETPFLLTGK